MRFRRLPFAYIILLLCLFVGKAYAQNLTVSTVTGAISNCVGAASSNSTIARFTAGGTNLLSAITATAQTGFEVSMTATGAYSNSVNAGSGGTIYVRATASNTAGPISGNVVLSSTGAFSRGAFVRGDINALPTVNAISNQTVTNGSNTTTISFSGTGPVYNWANSDPSIGLVASGTGDILSFTAVNTTASPKIANITVTPRPPGFLYTANDNSVSVVDLVTHMSAIHIPFVKTPTKTIVSSDNRYVYVLCANDDKIAIIATASNTVVANWPLPALFMPYQMELSPDGTKLAVSGLTQTVFFDTATGNILAQPNAPGDSRSLFSKDGSTFYAISAGSNQLSFINTATFAIDNTIALKPAGNAVLSPDGNTLYIAGSGASEGIYAVNTVTRQIINNISTGTLFSYLSISPNGERLYATSATSNILAIINTATNGVVNSVITSNNPGGTLVSRDNNYVFLTYSQDKLLDIYNTVTGSLDRSTLAAATSPPVANADGSRLYLSVPAAGVILVYNTATKTYLTPIVAERGVSLSSNSFNYGSLCDGLPQSFTITVNPILPPPIITTTGSINNLTTTYGTASAPDNFTLSATNLTAAIAVVPPAGFEISLDNINYSNTLNVGAAGTLSPTIIYVRLTARTDAGPYTGDIRLSSGTAVINQNIPLSTITPAPLTVTAGNLNKPYGEVLVDGAGALNITVTAGSLKNNNTITGVTYSYGLGKASTAVVNVYNNSIDITAVSGANGFLASNYAITFIKGSISVIRAVLDIKATNNTKLYGTGLPTNQLFTATGLKNGETVTSVDYSYADGTLPTSNAGLYAGKIMPLNAVGTFSLSNYTVNYATGDLLVLQAPLVITANNASKNFGSVNPVFTATYTGFVNNENESQLSTLPIFSTTATLASPGGEYPVIPSGAAAANYAIGYVNGSLTVIPSAQLIIPNAFTPNNDGVNDTWKIPALTSYPNCRVQVFNRNGIQVYTSVGYVTDWDGTINGKGLPTGVYYYIIDTKVFGLKATGAITLVR